MSDQPKTPAELRQLVAHGMSVPSGLAGRMIDRIEELEALNEKYEANTDKVNAYIEELESENAKLQAVVDAAKVLTYADAVAGAEAFGDLQEALAALKGDS